MQSKTENMHSISWENFNDQIDFPTSFDLHVPYLEILNAPPLEEIEPKECSICQELTQVEAMFDSIHPCCSNFCKEVTVVTFIKSLTFFNKCMTNYIRTKIDDGTSYEFKCPAVECGIILMEEELHNVLDETYRAKRHALSLKLALSSMQDFR